MCLRSHASTTDKSVVRKRKICLEINLAEMKLCSKLLADNQITLVNFKQDMNDITQVFGKDLSHTIDIIRISVVF